MCDTFAFAHSDGTWFGKNSDREPDEPQRVEYVAPVRDDASRELRTSYITIAQQPHRHGYLMGRPDWLWGAEMGVNDQGLAVGNEAVFTCRAAKAETALLGMDLVRLALERAASAEEGVAVITALLSQYGQGGPAGYRNKKFRYDNSFLLADNQEIWVLETAGREWQAQRATLAAISNRYSLAPPFDKCSSGIRQPFIKQHKPLLTFFSGANNRRHCALAAATALQQSDAVAPDQVMNILRTHVKTKPTGNADLCMHAAGPLRPSETTNAMVALLSPQGPRVWFTGCSQPCCSVFYEVGFDAGLVAEVFCEGYWERERERLLGMSVAERGDWRRGISDRQRAILKI